MKARVPLPPDRPVVSVSKCSSWPDGIVPNFAKSALTAEGASRHAYEVSTRSRPGEISMPGNSRSGATRARLEPRANAEQLSQALREPDCAGARAMLPAPIVAPACFLSEVSCGRGSSCARQEVQHAPGQEPGRLGVVLVGSQHRAHAGRTAGAAVASGHQFARPCAAVPLAGATAARSGRCRRGSCRRGRPLG